MVSRRRKNGKLVTKTKPGKSEQTLAKKNSTKKAASDKPFYVVTIGASAGGINAINELVSQINPEINAAFFVVLHLSKAALGEILTYRIKKNSRLPCTLARQDDIIERGQIYIAQPDAHLLVRNDKIIVGHGPAENRFRPSIDVLFRSSASNYGPRTIGVVLTGFLNDGTAGMLAIKQSGGFCIVQDPNEAEYPSMPLSVLETMNVDHGIPLKEMGLVIQKITNKIPVKNKITPLEVIAESRLSERSATGINEVRKIGEKTILACPDCGGGLWAIGNSRVKRYRCHIGHSYSEADLELGQSEAIERTLWVSVRMMKERKNFLTKLAAEHKTKGLIKISNAYYREVQQLEDHIRTIKNLLFGNNIKQKTNSGKTNY